MSFDAGAFSEVAEDGVKVDPAWFRGGWGTR